MNQKEEIDQLIFEMNIAEDNFAFTSSIESALLVAQKEKENLIESIQSVENLKSEADKLDYVLAASVGAITGLLDIFLVGKPGESPIGDITDKWFENRVEDFSRLCGWEGDSSAIGFLEKKFKVPYDQRGAGDAGSRIFNLNPSNHHFKSLGHNPSLFGLFFSILDQFKNQSHFISEGKMISLQEASGKFVLRGNNIPSKLFCGFINWLGHLFSDVSGSSGSRGRGMGIPSPLWTWTNNVIAVKSKLGVTVSQFDKDINELALDIYSKGYDSRFQAAQAIPVFVNEILVRTVFSIRRMLKYYAITDKEERSAKALWKACEPFSNTTVKRMLTVSHGTFCLFDLSDATIRGFTKGAGSFNTTEFFLRLNIVGVGRFFISIYGEANRAIKIHKTESENQFLKKKMTVLENYMSGLEILSKLYDDKDLLLFVDELRKSDIYIQAFEKSVQLARLRKVPEDMILKSKSDIDDFFKGDNNNAKT